MFEARLVGGQADPGGAWAYGRLQVFTGQFFSSITEQMNFNSQELGVRGVAVACRSLGFSTGAQLTSGMSSGIPGQDGAIDTLGAIRCMGDEDTLADCTVGDYTSEDDNGDDAVALLCTTPSGMTCVTRARETCQMMRLSGAQWYPLTPTLLWMSAYVLSLRLIGNGAGVTLSMAPCLCERSQPLHSYCCQYMRAAYLLCLCVALLLLAVLCCRLFLGVS